MINDNKYPVNKKTDIVQKFNSMKGNLLKDPRICHKMNKWLLFFKLKIYIYVLDYKHYMLG